MAPLPKVLKDLRDLESRMQALLLELLPKPLLTRDQVRQLEVDNVVSEEAEREARTLRALGVTPTAMETVLPSYLVRFRRTGQYWRKTVSV